MRPTVVLCLLFVSIFAPLCFAGEIIGDFYYGDNKIDRELDIKFFTFNNFHLGTTTIDDIIKFYGDTQRSSNEEQSPYRYCYISESRDIRVIFSSGPYGAWESIDEVYLLDKQYNFDEKMQCKVSDVATNDLRGNPYFQLGKNRRFFLDVFGEPSIKNDGKWYYYFEKKKPLESQNEGTVNAEHKEGNYYVSSFITINFACEKASAIAVKTLEER